jgi:hypothetical protein
MSDGRIGDGSDGLATTGVLRVIGFPGTFTAWGLACVRQILETSGYTTQFVPLDRTSSDADDATVDTSVAVHVLIGHGPVVVRAGIVPLRTIVLFDTPARPFRELLALGYDPVDAARALTATLAPLAAVLREDGVLLVRRTPEMDPVATRLVIANHISGILTLPSAMPPDCPPIDIAAPVPALVGQALALLRQSLTPLVNFVIDTARDPIVWPLACFYAGDHLNEQASSFIEVVGPARILYYGPYFYLPQGRWRADVQLIASGNMHDKKLAVDVYAGVALARHEFKPPQGGLLQASLLFVVERAEERIEVRVELMAGAIEGYLGLKQVLLHPITQ